MTSIPAIVGRPPRFPGIGFIEGDEIRTWRARMSWTEIVSLALQQERMMKRTIGILSIRRKLMAVVDVRGQL